MNETRNAIVIDSKGHKKTFVLVEFIKENEDEKAKEKPMYYTLNHGESLIYHDIPIALSMLKPIWNGLTWEETATEEEIESAKPEPVEQKPTETDLLAAELSLAITEMQVQLDMAIAELSMAITTQ